MSKRWPNWTMIVAIALGCVVGQVWLAPIIEHWLQP